MSWYVNLKTNQGDAWKLSFMELGEGKAFDAAKSALLALKFTRPDLDPANCDFSELVNALTETGKIPPGMNPERFAAQVVFVSQGPKTLNVDKIV